MSASDWLREYRSVYETDPESGLRFWREIHLRCNQVVGRVEIRSLSNSTVEAEDEIAAMKRLILQHEEKCPVPLQEVAAE